MLLDRFLRYVRIDTTADDSATTYPSSTGQLELGKLLVEELRAIGLTDVEHDEFGLVYATIPATTQPAAGQRLPVVGFNAHLDTSPETTGKNVQPQVFNYQGGDITLPADPTKVIRVADNPELSALVGQTLVTTDGTTLLGADDKAGLAVIMQLAEHLVQHPELPHGPIRLLFTCDEEIGQGVKHVDLKKLGADVCYTLDGFGRDEIDVETFSADLAKIVVRGVNIHPSIGKGRMVNAIRVAAALLDKLPRNVAPEQTDGRDGFLHPYGIDGGVAEAHLRVLLRDFETSGLESKALLLRETAAAVEKEFPGSAIEVQIIKQYRNLAEGLAKEPRAVAYAQQAYEKLGRTPRRTIIRGGTDGSQLTEKGLPTPNLSTGEHNPHSPLEWTCLEEMQAAVDVLVELVQIWAKA